MADQQKPGNNRLPILQLKGLDERTRYVNPDPTAFDKLQGFVQQKAGAIQRPNGIQQLVHLPGHRILNIAQTFDTKRNVLVQTDQGLMLYTEDEIFGRPPTHSLTPVTPPPDTEEENMAQGLITHSLASGTSGGGTSAGVWVSRLLNNIVEQYNPDGTAASFITAIDPITGHFTLAAGVYRIFIKSIRSNPNAAILRARMRLYNVTAALPAWNGLQHEESTSERVQQNTPVALFSEGTLNLAVPTILRVEEYSDNNAAASGQGLLTASGKPEVYCFVRILKTQ